MFIKGNLPLLGAATAGGTGPAAGVFDGIDLDWEWPGSEGNTGNVIRPEDKANFTALLAEFRTPARRVRRDGRQALPADRFLPADPAKIAAGFEAGQIFKSPRLRHRAGLRLPRHLGAADEPPVQLFNPAANPAPVKFSVDGAVNSVDLHRCAGGEAVVGLPAYGRGWTGVPPCNNGL